MLNIEQGTDEYQRASNFGIPCSALCGSLEFLRDFFNEVRFDHIACFEVGEVVRTNTALLPLADFGSC